MIEPWDIHNVIEEAKGISFAELLGLFPEEPTILIEDWLQQFIQSGLVTKFQGLYYPVHRLIGKIPKGHSETVDEIDIGGIAVAELKTTFTPNEDDPLLFDGYPIDESKAGFFEKFDQIQFDFDQFDYYLLSAFDN